MTAPEAAAAWPLPAGLALDANVAFTVAVDASQEVVFGRGARRQLGALVGDPGPVGVIASRSQVAGGTTAEACSRLMVPVRVFTDVQPHATEELCRRARDDLLGVRVVVSIGGGSAIGIAKAVAAELDVPLAALPTTYSGSEMTPLYGVTANGVKTVRSHPGARPRIVVYDPDLTDGLPGHERWASLMNSLAHALECGWNAAPGSHDASAASQAIARIASGLLLLNRGEAAGGDQLLAGALCAGAALAVGRIGLHHATCHAVGGLTRAPHGDINAVVLPAAMAALAPAYGDAQAQLVQPLRAVAGGGGAAHDVIAALRTRWELPTRLRDVGVTSADLSPLARLIAAHVPESDRVDEERIADLLVSLI